MRKKSVETEKSACWKNRPLLPYNTKSKGGFQNSATTKAELSVARLLDLLLKRSKIIYRTHLSLKKYSLSIGTTKNFKSENLTDT